MGDKKDKDNMDTSGGDVRDHFILVNKVEDQPEEEPEKNIAKFVVKEAEGRGTISLNYKGKKIAKNFVFTKGQKGQLLTDIFENVGDNPKIWNASGDEFDPARAPEALEDGGSLEVAGVKYVLQSEQAQQQQQQPGGGLNAVLPKLPPTNLEMIAKIQAKFKDAPDVIEILTCFSGIRLRDLAVSSNFAHSSLYLQNNLPSAVGSPTTMDLRLLPGNLDDPNGQIPAVANVLKRLVQQDELGYADMHVLLAGHAMGKTKAIFDIACTRYTILLDASGDNVGHSDIRALRERVEICCAQRDRYPTSIHFERDVQKQFLICFGARLVMLQLYLATREITPTEWRNAQLNGLVTHYYLETLEPITAVFSTYNYDKLKNIVERLLSHHHRATRLRMVASFDEANIWLDQHFFFTPPEGAPEETSGAVSGPVMQKGDRPVWYAIAKTFFYMNPVAMVVAGTRIRLSDTKRLFSSTAKIGVSAGRDVIIHSAEEFPACSCVDILKLSDRVFTANFTLEMRELLATRLCGNKKTRPRFFTTYVEFLADTSKTPVELLDTYIEKLVAGPNEKWSICYQLDKVRDQFRLATDAYNDLCKLLVQYISAEDGLIAEPSNEKVDWMAGGICLVERTGDKLHYRIAENLIVDAIDRYLESKNFSIVGYFVGEMTRSQADTAHSGALFDFLMAWAIRGAAKRGELNFLKYIPWASHKKMEKKMSVHTHVLPFLQGDQQILVPEKKVRIDIITKDLPVHIFSGNKITFIKNAKGTRKSVDSRGVRKNHRTTDLLNIYTKEKKDETTSEDSQYKDTRKEIFKWYSQQIEGKHVTGIVRLHICLPYAPDPTKGKGHQFVPGEIRLAKRVLQIEGKKTTFPEASIDVDSSCLELLGIFESADLDFLRNLFPLKKGRSPISAWKVSKVDMEPTETTEDVGMDLSPTKKRPYSILQEYDVVRVCERCNNIRLTADFSHIDYCDYCAV